MTYTLKYRGVKVFGSWDSLWALGRRLAADGIKSQCFSGDGVLLVSHFAPSLQWLPRVWLHGAPRSN